MKFKFNSPFFFIHLQRPFRIGSDPVFHSSIHWINFLNVLLVVFIVRLPLVVCCVSTIESGNLYLCNFCSFVPQRPPVIFPPMSFSSTAVHSTLMIYSSFLFFFLRRIVEMNKIEKDQLPPSTWSWVDQKNNFRFAARASLQVCMVTVGVSEAAHRIANDGIEEATLKLIECI